MVMVRADAEFEPLSGGRILTAMRGWVGENRESELARKPLAEFSDEELSRLSRELAEQKLSSLRDAGLHSASLMVATENEIEVQDAAANAARTEDVVARFTELRDRLLECPISEIIPVTRDAWKVLDEAPMSEEVLLMRDEVAEIVGERICGHSGELAADPAYEAFSRRLCDDGQALADRRERAAALSEEEGLGLEA
jgi:hypothetical protein